MDVLFFQTDYWMEDVIETMFVQVNWFYHLLKIPASLMATFFRWAQQRMLGHRIGLLVLYCPIYVH